MSELGCTGHGNDPGEFQANPIIPSISVESAHITERRLHYTNHQITELSLNSSELINPEFSAPTRGFV